VTRLACIVGQFGGLGFSRVDNGRAFGVTAFTGNASGQPRRRRILLERLHWLQLRTSESCSQLILDFKAFGVKSEMCTRLLDGNVPALEFNPRRPWVA